MEKCEKNANKYICEKCDFKCSKMSNWEVHIRTRKHRDRTKSIINMPKNNCFICKICNKEYNARNSLWYHQQKCKPIQHNIEDKQEESVKKLTDLLSELVKDNKEMKQIIIHQNDAITNYFKNNISNINNVNNISNKSFNLNLFLNETCKDAMNIMDFANSIQPKLADLENIGELGYVDGISKIIIDNLKLLDVSQRPVHCSDFKRDVIYVKNNDKWEKDDAIAKIKKVINCVTNKNISLISEWKKQNPDCIYSDSIKSTKINKMIMEVMETDPLKKDKIIKNIAKQVIINK
jgi:hypothetical protein